MQLYCMTHSTRHYSMTNICVRMFVQSYWRLQKSLSTILVSLILMSRILPSQVATQPTRTPHTVTLTYTLSLIFQSSTMMRYIVSCSPQKRTCSMLITISRSRAMTLNCTFKTARSLFEVLASIVLSATSGSSFPASSEQT